MRGARFLPFTFSLCLLFPGCASVDKKFGNDAWYQKTRSATNKAVETSTPAISKAIDVSTTAAAKAFKRMQKYLAEKDLLATFHDAGQHSEEAVLAVLRQSGLTRAKPARPGQPPAQGPAPSPNGPAGQKPPAKTPIAPLGNVPEHYAGNLIWPVDAGIFSSEFGKRARDDHKGIDIAADVGEPVHAIADGDVIYAGNGLRGYGNVVILRHDRNMSSLYAHNSELKVRQGDHVRQGALISLLGSTGRSTGPHVHFEIREGDRAINPRSVLPKPAFGWSLFLDGEKALALN
jgi:murein DD-endopeptidase MepM/ murein hydrolase activator NlpD